ncbi:hypothetical protein H7X87_02650 [Acetobacteraceae bacterium]|nr:hypothetical protein [Candidatus Parcubacteria bacterium]
MNDVLLTNIFFTITGLAVLVVTGGIVVLLWYILPIVRDLREIVRKIRSAGDAVEKDFEALRVNLREEGSKSKAILDAGLAFAARKIGVRRKKKEEVE